MRTQGKPTEKPSTPETKAIRARFLEASVLLAGQLGISVEALGYLFDRVLTTGTRQPSEDDEKAADDESSEHGITLKLQTSEGVLLFLVREISGAKPSSYDYPDRVQTSVPNFDTVDYWHQRGYRLTDIRFYSRTFADHMGVSKNEMDVFLGACKPYARRGVRPVVQTGGTYLGLFAVRPSNSLHGLDVLVYNFARHQIPAYRLPDVSYPLSGHVKAWIRENSSLTMGELLQRAEDAVHLAETSDSGSGSYPTQEDESLYEFQAAIAIAINSLTTALRPWPHIQQLARLSPEILELPSSNFDDHPPGVMVVLEVILPAPESRLTPVQSRMSGVQAPALNIGREEADKPPLPFIYTPWTLFAKSQNMIMRGKTWTDVCRHFSSELSRLYPHLPTDLAEEVAAAEKGTDTSQTLPQAAGKWSSRASRVGQGLGIDTARRSSVTNSITSPGFTASEGDDDLEKGFGDVSESDVTLQNTPALTPGHRTRPSTGATDGIRTGLSALISRKPDEQTMEAQPGPPIYQSVRGRTDQ